MGKEKEPVMSIHADITLSTVSLSVNMIQQLSQDHYEMLEKMLKENLPFSFAVYYPVSYLRKRTMKNRIVWVDSWPEFNVVLVSDNKHKNAVTQQRICCYCKDVKSSSAVDAMLRVVANTLSNNLFMFGCPSGVIDELINHHSCPLQRVSPDAFILTLPMGNIDTKPIPDGFRVTCLEPEQVDTLVRTWPYTSVFPDCREWVTEMIDLFPSVCIKDRNGEPVAWIVQQDYGCIGMLQVVPKYQRAKLGSAATMLLAQKLCEENYNVYSAVNVENSVSVAFHEKNRFEYVKDFTVGFVKYLSKE